MRFDQCAKKSSDPFFSALNVVIDDAQLVGIGAAVALHGEGFAAPDQLGAAFTKMLPAAKRVLGGLTVGCAIPAFHRMNAPSIADDEITNIERGGKRTSLLGRQNALIHRQRKPQLREPCFNRAYVLQMSNFRKIFHIQSRRSDILATLNRM